METSEQASTAPRASMGSSDAEEMELQMTEDYLDLDRVLLDLVRRVASRPVRLGRHARWSTRARAGDKRTGPAPSTCDGASCEDLAIAVR